MIVFVATAVIGTLNCAKKLPLESGLVTTCVTAEAADAPNLTEIVPSCPGTHPAPATVTVWPLYPLKGVIDRTGRVTMNQAVAVRPPLSVAATRLVPSEAEGGTVSVVGLMLPKESMVIAVPPPYVVTFQGMPPKVRPPTGMWPPGVMLDPLTTT
jgi:hypothetical protein